MRGIMTNKARLGHINLIAAENVYKLISGMAWLITA
jgi:hypothetical protein